MIFFTILFRIYFFLSKLMICEWKIRETNIGFYILEWNQEIILRGWESRVMWQVCVCLWVRCVHVCLCVCVCAHLGGARSCTLCNIWTLHCDLTVSSFLDLATFQFRHTILVTWYTHTMVLYVFRFWTKIVKLWTPIWMVLFLTSQIHDICL